MQLPSNYLVNEQQNYENKGHNHIIQTVKSRYLPVADKIMIKFSK